MTPFTDDPSATLFRIVDPVTKRNGTSVYPVMGDKRFLPLLDEIR
jgi:hypothetical protein